MPIDHPSALLDATELPLSLDVFMGRTRTLHPQTIASFANIQARLAEMEISFRLRDTSFNIQFMELVLCVNRGKKLPVINVRVLSTGEVTLISR